MEIAFIVFYLIITSTIITVCSIGKFILADTAWKEIEKYLKDLFRKW